MLSQWRSSPFITTTSPGFAFDHLWVFLLFMLCRPLRAFKYSADHLDHHAFLHAFLHRCKYFALFLRSPLFPSSALSGIKLGRPTIMASGVRVGN
jgi:hypothetical protein